MTGNDFITHVQRIVSALSAISTDSDSITQEAIEKAHNLLLTVEGLTSSDRFLIINAARMQLELPPEVYTNKCRGSVYNHGIRREVVDSAKGEC